MSEIQQTFVQKVKNESARKRLGFQGLFFSSPDVDQDDALMRMALAFKDAGYNKEDFKKPIHINYPVVDDVPADRVLDTTFCDRYQLGGEDGKTMMPIAGAARTSEAMSNRASCVKKYTREQLIFGTWLFGLFDELSPEQLKTIAAIGMDDEATYAHNVELALRHESLRQLEYVFPETLADLFRDMKSIWPEESKSPQVSNLISFFSEWINTHTNDRNARDDVTAKWFARYQSKAPENSGPVSLVDSVRQSQAEATIDAGRKAASEPERYKRPAPQSAEGLSLEIATAQLYPDAVPGNVSRTQLTGAKAMRDRGEFVHVRAMKTLRGIPDIFEYDTATIFDVSRAIKWNSEAPTIELRAQARDWLEANGRYENGELPAGYAEWKDKQHDDTTSEPLHEEINTTDSDDISPRELDIKVQIVTALYGNTTIMDADEASELLGLLGIEQDAFIEALSFDLYHIEQEGADPVTDDEIHHLTCDALHNWIKVPARRVRMLEERLAIYRQDDTTVLDDDELRAQTDKKLAAGRGEVVEGVSDPEAPNWVHEDLAKTASNEVEKTEVLPPAVVIDPPVITARPRKPQEPEQPAATLTYEQQLTIAALQGLCANPVHAMIGDEIPAMAALMARSVVRHQDYPDE
ncbi:RecE family exodeoxyribonuclease [Klebsiella aerogenes]|uniref:RecE family exodeoxyribonuclease n=1 Tax=Klebsiella aerogenes TaxID=548 RepID=UPI0034D22842